MVAALGHRPPEGSVQFHLTLCSVDNEGKLALAEPGPDMFVRGGRVGELDELFTVAQRLRTQALTPLKGEGTDHALVWEGGSIDNETSSPGEAFGRELFSVLPRGEGESLLRRFVDDSVNLLGTLESNAVRRDEGLAPLNCLWPWGQGLRPDFPNLPLRRGDVVHVLSGSLRMQGLCRLAGYAHGDRHAFGTKLQTNYGLILENATAHQLSLAIVHSVEEMQRHGRTDEIEWNLEQLAANVIGPLLEREDPFELRLVAPCGQSTAGALHSGSSPIGLGLMYSSESLAANAFPFDERVLDDARVPTLNCWEFLQGGLLGSD
jgi:2,3-bisphosphoglycerate-independent phosphoglycerate mutase